MTRGPASMPRSLGLQVLLPRAGILLGWLALNQWIRMPVPLALALMAADGVFLLWQFRAFQRSADAQTRSTGAMAPVWGGYLVLLFAGFAALTQWWDALLIARHVEGTPYAEQQKLAREALYSLTVSQDGSTLVFAGEITHGLTRRMESMAGLHPELRRIALTGPGGLIAEARGAAKLIQEQGWATRADGLCASACTLVFAAGNPRGLGPEGQLGFHSYALMFEGGLPQVDLQKEQEKDLAYFLQQGISADFARKMFKIANGGLWIPESAELRAAGVITGGNF